MNRLFTLTAVTFVLSTLFYSCFERAVTPEEKAALAAKESSEKKERGTAEVARAAAGAEDTARQKVVAQAAANLGPVADAVEMKGQPGLANVTRDQKDSIVGALDVALPRPTVSLAGLLADAEKERVKAQAKADELQGKLNSAAQAAENAEKARAQAEAIANADRKRADEAEARANAEAAKAWWLKAGGVALGILGVMGTLAARLGLPGGSLVSSLFNVISPALAKNNTVATAAVAASDVGRSALGVLDAVLTSKPELAGAVSGVISELTRGRATKIEDLFKTAAKAYTIDTDGQHASAVDQFLTQVRGAVIDTKAGLPTVLTSLLASKT